MSWPQREIKEVARVVGGATPKTGEAAYWDGDVAWATPKDLAELSSKLIAGTLRQITNLGLRSCSAELLPTGSVLFSSRAPIGHIAINSVPMATNQGFKSFIPGPELDASFLYWWLDANRERLKAMGNGATFKEVSKAVVERIAIPVPPIPEQQRIVAILDQADALRRLRRESLSRLGELERALFYDMFGDPVSNPCRWKIGTIRDLVAEAKYGTAQKANTNRVGLPVLRMGNLTYDGHIDLTDLTHVELPKRDLDKYTTRRGDLLFNRTNSRDLVGKTAVVTMDDPMAVAGYLVRVRTNADGNPHYISGYLNSAPGKVVLQSMCKNIVGMANINAQDLQNIAIALPPVTLQDEFAERLSIIRHQRKGIGKAIAAANHLFSSLQHRAFRGEL